MKSKFLFAGILIAGLTLATLPMNLYGQETKKAATKKEAATTRFTCTHHPEVVSDKPGKCPKCGMDLVPMKSTASVNQHGGTMHHDKMKKDTVMHPKTKKDKTRVKKDTTMKMNKM